MKWYVAEYGMIREVEIAKATGKSVVFAHGNRAAIDSDWRWYRPTREEAKAAMVEHYKSEVMESASRLDFSKQC